VGAIAYIEKMPDQNDPTAYNVNLRDKVWKSLGYTDKDIKMEG
jgi:hypothetical protein